MCARARSRAVGKFRVKLTVTVALTENIGSYEMLEPLTSITGAASDACYT
jgi:hypothetical protein